MEALEPFLDLLRRFSLLHSQYMVTGGVAVIAYGEPRLTNDIDIVLALGSDEVKRIAEIFPHSQFYTPPSEVIEIEMSRPARGHFNIISLHSGVRVDVYLPGSDPLAKWGLEQRRFELIGDCDVPFAPLEYIIVKKLEFLRQSGSEKHLRDLNSVWKVSRSLIRDELLNQFLTQGKLEDLWEQAKTYR